MWKKLIRNQYIFNNKEIDYVRFARSKRSEIHFPKSDPFLPIYRSHPNVPEAFDDKYFSKKETETLFDLKEHS